MTDPARPNSPLSQGDSPGDSPGDRDAAAGGPLILGPAATRAALDPLRVMEAVERALIAISEDTVSAPPRIAAHGPHGLLGAMPAYVPGLGLAAKLVTVFPDPERPGRSGHRGVVALFDERRGHLTALVDAEPLTAVRTAAAATAAMRVLARPDARRIAIVGTGAQAAAQLALLAATGRGPRAGASAGRGTPADGPAGAEVVVAGRDPGRARALAASCPGALTAPIEDAVRGADVVFCCTGAHRPVVEAAWLAPGTHVSSVGGSEGPELDAGTVRAGALFTEWRGAVTAAPPAGAHELQGLPPERAVLIGDVLSGRHPGRRHPHEITVFKSTGHAALDVAAAHVVLTAPPPPR
ncbi:ornithine cyclodeaminase [Actinacidiphila rubida]|uniref:Ornithine cyclodeaminase n=1 Tax=Actinacidiphila rubida TaxID=310780 RepID=A0A1H8MVM7_9ACTN|nr:NAD(P)-binding domain-containing protein [Actinacidiphila rubida]SEO21298.1 ornithine cyclodeaminase [Actinacidiphila rubida]